MRYTDLIFDLYGTLVDIHTEENDQVWEKTAIFYGFYGVHCTADALRADFLSRMAKHQAAAGQSYECFPDIPCDKIFASIFLDHGVQNADDLGLQAAQLFRISSIEYIRVYPAVHQALETLRRHGFRLWLLSNAQRAFTAYELRCLQLDDCFDGIYISSDYLCRKPDSRFYQALLQQQSLRAENCLMIGNDRDTDIAGAKKLGMATLYMHTNLTPAEQEGADSGLLPECAPPDCRHFEFSGSDWGILPEIILQIAKNHR